jgi:hypothetical protein
MSSLFSLFRTLTKALSFAPNEPASSGYRVASPEKSLPSPVLDTINSIRAGKGWAWRGEYYTLPETSGSLKEILMYNTAGELRVVCIHERGEVISIAPREESPFHLYQAQQLSDYYLHL